MTMIFFKHKLTDCDGDGGGGGGAGGSFGMAPMPNNGDLLFSDIAWQLITV